MKIAAVEVLVQGRNEAIQSLLDSISDVPEKYRADDIPSWAFTFKVKRHLFNWLSRLGKVRLYIASAEHGVLTFKVSCSFLKGWSFSLTPELVYLMTNVALATMSDRPTDLMFVFRGRRVFIPFEVASAFLSSVDAARLLYRERMLAIHELITTTHDGGEAKKEEEKEEPKGKVKRVLH